MASLSVVVFGHWLMIYVIRSGNGLTGGNILAVVPGLWPLTWVFQVMPVFFLVGGFANLRSWEAVESRLASRGASRCEAYVAYLRSRAGRLLRPLVVFGCVWTVLAVALNLLELPDGRIATIGKLLLQPLWFLAVFLAVVALAPVMVALHRRFRLWVPVALAVAIVVVDLLRLRYGFGAVGYLNFLLVWTLVHQFGFSYADGGLERVSRRGFVLLGAAGLVALAVLTGSGAYSSSMVGLPGEPSNMSPPTLAIVVLATVQTAAIMLLRHRLRGWLRRPRPWTSVILLGSMTMTIYLWHQTAMLALLGAFLALDAPLPGPAGSLIWWLSRPVWLALLLLVLAPLVLVFARFERAQSSLARAS